MVMIQRESAETLSGRSNVLTPHHLGHGPNRLAAHEHVWRRYRRPWLSVSYITLSSKAALTALEVRDNIFVNCVTEMSNSILAVTQYHWRRVVWLFPSRSGIAKWSGKSRPPRGHLHSDQVKFIPHRLHQLVDVQPLF
jgi:hypothetical protein